MSNESKDFIAALNDMKNFRLFDINPIPRARVIEHPVEDGSVIHDNKVIEPLKVRVRGYVEKHWFDDVSKQLSKLLYWRGSDYTWHITTRFTRYDNLVLTAMPHHETPDKLDVTEFSLELTQLMLAKSKSESVSDPSNASRKSV